MNIHCAAAASSIFNVQLEKVHPPPLTFTGKQSIALWPVDKRVMPAAHCMPATDQVRGASMVKTYKLSFWACASCALPKPKPHRQDQCTQLKVWFVLIVSLDDKQYRSMILRIKRDIWYQSSYMTKPCRSLSHKPPLNNFSSESCAALKNPANKSEKVI